MSTKRIVTIGIVVLAVIAAVLVVSNCVGYNKDQNWQVVQKLGGEVIIRDKAGFYPHFFAFICTYPRYVEATYNDDPGEGRKAIESVRSTFNDGGTAQISTYVRFMTPSTESQRREFNRFFSGSVENAINAVKAHMINCIKATAPLMSASENQSARKAEFVQIIENMLSNGLYEMKKVERELKDRTDEKGKPITVFITEIIPDEKGMPRISKISPLKNYGITISQFSVTSTDYDEKILEQFAAKKDAFLAAEQSKADREKEVQQRLMVIEKGFRERAEVEAEANKVKAKAVIEAEQKVEVAEQAKQEAETVANKQLEVARIEKDTAETQANMELEVAKVRALAAEQDKLATIAKAEGKQQAIELSGAITEEMRVSLEIEAEKQVNIAKALAVVKTPGIVMVGGDNGSGNGTNYKDTLMNLYLLEKLGVKIGKIVNPEASPPVLDEAVSQ